MAAKSPPASIQVSGKSLGQTLSPGPREGTLSGDKRPESARSKDQPSPTENSALEQVMDINRRLVGQIETLRLKVEVDARHHAESKTKLLTQNTSKLKTRELEIENLRSDLKVKEQKVKTLKEENKDKVSEIQSMQQHIDELKEDLRLSKNYADEIQTQLDLLQKAKSNLENGTAYSEKDNEIKQLQTEVTNLKQHLMTLERELTKAKQVIAQQGGKLRLAEIDRGNVQLKFKMELAKVTQIMRNEIEKMRDVMRQQWEEMRELRNQNEGMRSDLREIRELLQAEQNPSPSVSADVHSPFSMKSLTPSLPALNKDTRRTARKKT